MNLNDPSFSRRHFLSAAGLSAKSSRLPHDVEWSEGVALLTKLGLRT
jgi:hypothetical protein